jgi:HK97 family phage portal protein
MGIFSRKKREEVTDQLSTANRPAFWEGPTKAGIFVNERTAMQTAAVYACVRVIAEAVASLPLHVYRYEGDGTRLDPEHHLYYLLHDAPNEEMTSFSFRETLMSHLLLYGNAYAQILRDGHGRVRGLYPLLPNKMDVNRGDDGKLYYTYWRNYDETRPNEKSGGIAFTREEILHIPGLSFDGISGYSPIELARNAIGMAAATEEYGASFFKNGANPGAILEYPNTLDDPEKVRIIWEALYKGGGNGNRLAVLEDGMKFKQVAISPENAQFLETRKFQINEISRIFRVPLHMIGDLDKSSFSNIEQQSMEFVKYTLDPWVVRWEQAMRQSLVLPSERSSTIIKFNLDGLLRGDYETRMNGYAVGIQNGFLCPNDVRKLENMNRIPAEEGGDFFVLNGNMVRLKDAGAAYKKGEQGDA